MERCLRKLVLDADLTVLGDSEREAGSLSDHQGENIVLGGLDCKRMGVYSQPPKSQKTNSGYALGPPGG